MTIISSSSSEEHSEPKRMPQDLDLETLRLNQDFASEVGVRKLVTTIPVRRPDNHAFFRIRAEDEFKLPVALLEFRELNEKYIINHSLAAQMPGEAKRKMLTVGITRQGSLFVWPLPLPGPDGKQISWHASAIMAAELAEKRWVRISPNMDLGIYDLFQAEAELPEPLWPELTMSEIVQIAFREQIISDISHPVLQRLRGEV